MPVSPVARGFVRTVLATAAFGLVHSVMADHRLKDAAERAWGTRRRNAFYRPVYNGVSVVTLAGLLTVLLRQPSRTLYDVRGPARAAMRLGQAGSLGLLAWAALRTGPLKFAGLHGLWSWAIGKPHVPRPPAGQGPDRHADGTVKAVGPFAHVRMPANVAMIPLLGLNPTMTTRLAAFALTTSAYAVLGSLHSDRVLRREYGPRYDDYRRRVPLLVPRPRR